MENSILSLPPGEFLFALNELGLPDDQREFLLSQYGAPEPRPPVPEGRSFGYHLLDNIIGFDDDYVTRGEALKSGMSDTLSAIAADPLGAAWSAAKSVPEQAYDLIDRGMRGEATPLEMLEIATMPALGSLTAASRAGRGIASLADYDPTVASIFGSGAPKATTPNQPAIIRPDDVYRGEGTPRITVRQTDQPFVVRGTQQDQIDDMIQSGLVRPKPGGWKGSPQLYFGESPTSLPTDIRARPSETRFVMVGDSDKLAGTEGPIPIDQLRHVWVVRNGETVDVLPEILRANRDFGNTGR
jgi:hypothetical protein